MSVRNSRLAASAACALALLLGLASGTRAQDMPRGPAEIITQTQQRRAARDPKPLTSARDAVPPDAGAATQPSAAGTAKPVAVGPVDDNATLPPGHVPIPAEDAQIQGEAQAGGDPHSGVDGAPPLEPKPAAVAQASHDVPVGSIRVHIVDALGRPVPNADLQLGKMQQQAGRSSTDAKTGADGNYTFDKLPTGDGQAYRVNLLFQGSKVSSTPFRLPVDSGYDVSIRRFDVTRDNHDIVLYVGATSVELKDERLKIVQQARVFNVGKSTYVFPEQGLLVPLPKDALAFQADEVMTDQHLKEVKGQGFNITGSIPPGEVTLTWGFDVPREGTEADLSFDIPWPAFAYRVLADAAPGMTLAIDGMPEPRLQQDEGRRFLVSESVKNPGELPLRVLKIHLRGIPGPGPMRYIALVLGLLVIGAGLTVARRAPGSVRARDAEHLEQREAALLERAKRLQVDHEQGEIGPEFHAKVLAELEDDLAAILFERSRIAKS